MKLTTAIIAALLAAYTCSDCAQAADKPNVLFILTDDQAPWALGLSGHPDAKTPHLDKLFRSSAYLVNAFTTTPVCSPSRAGLMTGRYGSELGITDWINPRFEYGVGLPPSSVCWTEVLQQHGYTNGLIGKWHLGVPDRFHPTRAGFDYFMGFRSGGTKVKGAVLETEGQQQTFPGFTTDVLTDYAIDFIEHNQAKPFVCCVHYRAPHAPWLPQPESDLEPFKDLDPTLPHPDYPKLDVKKVKQKTREYLGSVHGVDRNVGRLMQTLDDLELADNTIVVFTSDHGYNMGHNGIWHKGNGHWILTEFPEGTENVPRRQRPNMYDNSIRVPTAIRWPGVIKPGTIVEETFSNLDWYPTLLGMAGVPLPADTILRGRSIVPVLEGKPTAWDNDFYAEYSTKHQSHTHMRMYRTPRWKLVRDFLNPDRDELYDLEADPTETTNLIHKDTRETNAAIEKLHAKIIEHMQDINDPVLALVQ